MGIIIKIYWHLISKIQILLLTHVFSFYLQTFIEIIISDRLYQALWNRKINTLQLPTSGVHR